MSATASIWPMLVATLLGLLIGLERERKGTFGRTVMVSLVFVGAASAAAAWWLLPMLT